MIKNNRKINYKISENKYEVDTIFYLKLVEDKMPSFMESVKLNTFLLFTEFLIKSSMAIDELKKMIDPPGYKNKIYTCQECGAKIKRLDNYKRHRERCQKRKTKEE